MNVRFGSWNVNHRRLTGGHLDILRQADLGLVAFQEASSSFYADLETSGMFDWGVFSLDLQPPGPDEGKSRRLGCSIFGRTHLRLQDATLIPGVAFPERTLVAEMVAGQSSLTACSFHTPPGASWKKIKPQTLVTIARWLAARSGTTVFGIDANCPKTDHPDIQRNDWWWPDESMMLGPSPLHSLKDAYRTYLEGHPDEWQRVVAARPNGPLAVSHVRGNSRKRTDCRYDFIYVTEDVRVAAVGDLARAEDTAAVPIQKQRQ